MTEPPVESDLQQRSYGQRAASGVLWTSVQKWAVRVFSFATIAILTRFLSPADFGTVAAAGTVLPFFYLLADLGFAAYIVQADHIDQRLLSTAFWYSTITGLCLAAVVIGVAPVLGLLFRDSQFVSVLQVLASSVVITAIGSVPSALLRREMRFRTLAWQGAVAAVVAQGVAVAMTLAGLGVWALVGQTLSSSVLMTGLTWIAAKWSPRLEISLAQLSALVRYGGQVLGVEFVAMLRAWAEAAIISATLGLAVLGYLSIAQKLVQIVQELTGAAVVPVTTVTFAKIRSAPERLRSAYLRALRVIYAVLSPPLILMAVAAPLIVPIIFGDGWSATHRVAQVLALAGTMTIGASLDQGLHYGLGRPGKWFAYALVVDAATVAMTAATVRWGLEAVAWGFVAVALAATVSRWFLVARLLQAPVRMMASPAALLVGSVSAGGLAGLLVVGATSGLNPFARISLAALAVGTAAIGAVWVLGRPVFDEATAYLSRALWARRSSRSARARGRRQ